MTTNGKWYAYNLVLPLSCMYITSVLRASKKCRLVIEYLASNFLFSLAQWARALASKPRLAQGKQNLDRIPDIVVALYTLCKTVPTKFYINASIYDWSSQLYTQLKQLWN